jgi:hypothetical protein
VLGVAGIAGVVGVAGMAGLPGTVMQLAKIPSTSSDKSDVIFTLRTFRKKFFLITSGVVSTPDAKSERKNGQIWFRSSPRRPSWLAEKVLPRRLLHPASASVRETVLGGNPVDLEMSPRVFPRANIPITVRHCGLVNFMRAPYNTDVLRHIAPHFRIIFLSIRLVLRIGFFFRPTPARSFAPPPNSQTYRSSIPRSGKTGTRLS